MSSDGFPYADNVPGNFAFAQPRVFSGYDREDLVSGIGQHLEKLEFITENMAAELSPSDEAAMLVEATRSRIRMAMDAARDALDEAARQALASAAQGIEARSAETRGGSVEDESPVDKVDAPPSPPPTGEGLPEEMLGALVDALDSPEVRQVQGFHYPPKFVIRDCMRKPGNQVVWEGPDTTDEAFFARQCEIERMRVAVGLAFTRSAAGRAALPKGRRGDGR